MAAPAIAPADGKSAALEPGAVHEECLAMQGGQVLRFAYRSDRPLEFNVHYHLGDAVHYPVRRAAADAHHGEFTAASAQHYCMMWANEGQGTAALEYEFQLDARAQ